MTVATKDYAAIRQQYQAIKADEPARYARDIARKLGISEAELTQARVGHDAVRLVGDMRGIIAGLEAVGETKSICRNEYAVHEQTGRFTRQHLGDHAGLVLNPRALDLRLFMSQWSSAFYLHEQSSRGKRQSIQFFDRHGDALLKVYATPETDLSAWQALVARFTAGDDVPLLLEALVPAQYAPSADAQALCQQWRAMNDVHQFFNLLKKHNISRQQAFRLVDDELAYQVDNGALARLLATLLQDGNEIMIFVGNRGCVQIFTGALEKLSPTAGWLNIFNSRFTLHLRDNEIAESWVTRKPTADGHVTSLELFARDGTQIAQLYGQRSEGEPEQAQWRGQIAALLREEGCAS